MEEHKRDFPLTWANYKIMIAGIALLIIGYALMAGGGSDNPNEFNDAVFSFRRITLAPIVVLLGYGVIFFSILKKTE